ncbi:hypothetical protein EYF80_053398 [Liparis tanakae]|uniref:Uncharacterized protein n=1 Tax=Liparis tanakae TaxID=230148 RepID=A0A4Z2F810_9TELE|nr:hypothetical protein EYF80_053398 [Liparis tanakae]
MLLMSRRLGSEPGGPRLSGLLWSPVVAPGTTSSPSSSSPPSSLLQREPPQVYTTALRNSRPHSFTAFTSAAAGGAAHSAAHSSSGRTPAARMLDPLLRGAPWALVPGRITRGDVAMTSRGSGRVADEDNMSPGPSVVFCSPSTLNKESLFLHLLG